MNMLESSLELGEDDIAEKSMQRREREWRWHQGGDPEAR
jgi:hypothetical protein